MFNQFVGRFNTANMLLPADNIHNLEKKNHLPI
jgi:hypothetical protein